MSERGVVLSKATSSPQNPPHQATLELDAQGPPRFCPWSRSPPAVKKDLRPVLSKPRSGISVKGSSRVRFCQKNASVTNNVSKVTNDLVSSYENPVTSIILRTIF